MFHGTAEENLDSIVESGFDPRRSEAGNTNGAVFGRGTYFASASAYSRQDSYAEPNSSGDKHVIVARIVVGRRCIGTSTMIQGASITGSPIMGDCADTGVNRLMHPSIYVKFQLNQAVPEFIIKFRET